MTKDIKKYQFKKGLPVEFEIVDIKEQFKKVKHLLNTPHRTNFYHIIWNQVGEPTHLIDFEPITVGLNSLLFLNKDTVQRFDVETYNEGKVILFTEQFYCKTKDDTKFLKSTSLFNDLFSISKINLGEITDLISGIVKMMEMELNNTVSDYQTEILRNLLSNFLLISERELNIQGNPMLKNKPELNFLLGFRDEIEHHYKSIKQVSVFADKINISVKKLNSITSLIMGKSPKQMIDDRVLLEAKRLLVHSTMSVKEIAFELGFEEPTNFIKYFRKHNNLTPVEFRDSFK